MTTRDGGDDGGPKRETLREKARRLRREAYQKAKERNAPRMAEAKAQARERRRAAYQKAKEAHKERQRKAADAEREKADATAEADEAARQAELMATLVPASELAPRPKLRLVPPPSQG
jgi:colicin import membrane protein